MPLQGNIGHLPAETVLVREDTPFPDTVVRSPGDSLRSAWPAARTGALAVFLRSTRRALRKILANADLAGLNTVEIASITVKELLGIQFACIEARLRHIQQGLVLTPEMQGHD